MQAPYPLPSESSWTAYQPFNRMGEGRNRSWARLQMASTKWSRATLRNATRRGGVPTCNGLKSRVFLVPCIGHTFAAIFRVSQPPGGFGIYCSGRWTPHFVFHSAVLIDAELFQKVCVVDFEKVSVRLSFCEHRPNSAHEVRTEVQQEGPEFADASNGQQHVDTREA